MDDKKYPAQFFEGQIDQSAGFIQPYKVGSGVMRGTQIIANTDGSRVILGVLPDSTDFGIAFLDPNGNLINKIIGPTQYVYDLLTGKNIIQIGKLPDGTYGMAVAKSGYNVSDGIS